MVHGTKEREGTLCSHARRACAEHPGPSWAPSAPSASNRFSCTSTPLSYHRTGSNLRHSLFVLLRPRTSFSRIDCSLFLLPILFVSLLPPFSHSLFLPNVLRLSLLPSDIRIQIQVRTSAALSLRHVLPPYVSSANNIRFHHLSQRRDAARRLAPSPANVHLLLPLLSPIDTLL